MIFVVLNSPPFVEDIDFRKTVAVAEVLAGNFIFLYLIGKIQIRYYGVIAFCLYTLKIWAHWSCEKGVIVPDLQVSAAVTPWGHTG